MVLAMRSKPNRLEPERIAARLSRLEADQRQSQREVADSIGMIPQTYSNKKNGRRPFSAVELDALASHFHTTVDYLMGRTDTPYPDPWKDKQ